MKPYVPYFKLHLNELPELPLGLAPTCIIHGPTTPTTQ